ncbi:Uu.00g091200.m01.CDS01 [Anthostomella pinea]|uniref:Uu.00g091200.m01.CDS01 n=1 Tax=Anthostomella pinea TaxID=933095 RepID=A0AAI8YHY4_9PEZI|nr:Uu.00g091200.m01.CDS01 [Anthostomella pinea]
MGMRELVEYCGRKEVNGEGVVMMNMNEKCDEEAFAKKLFEVVKDTEYPHVMFENVML